MNNQGKNNVQLLSELMALKERIKELERLNLELVEENVKVCKSKEFFEEIVNWIFGNMLVNEKTEIRYF